MWTMHAQFRFGHSRSTREIDLNGQLGVQRAAITDKLRRLS